MQKVSHVYVITQIDYSQSRDDKQIFLKNEPPSLFSTLSTALQS